MTDFESLTKPETEHLSEINRVHHYPAKMTTQLGEYFMNQYTTDRSGKLFDPFCGSGTTLVLGRIHGFESSGCEILRVPREISVAKASTLPLTSIEKLEAIKDSCEISAPNELDTWENREIWFHDAVYADLMALRGHIMEYRDTCVFPQLFTALSNVVWEVSSADPDILVPTRSKWSENNPFYETDEIIKIFKNSLEKLIEIQELHRDYGLSEESPQVVQGDAKNLETWPNQDEFDVILTSPPYGDGINYRRSISLQTRFFDLPDRLNGEKITKQAVGRVSYHLSEEDEFNFDEELLDRDYFEEVKENNPDRAPTIYTYLNDMAIVLENMANSLSDSGIIGIVIGNPEVADVRIPLNELIIELATEAGLVLFDKPKKDKITDRAQTPVRRSSNNPISHEYLITFEKSE